MKWFKDGPPMGLLRVPSKRTSLLIVAGVLFLSAGYGTLRYLRDPVTYDLIVEGGRVFTGDAWAPSGTKIGILNGRILRLGRLFGAKAKRRIDVHGQVISPGFIDTHVHIEGSMGAQRPVIAENFLRMGATTLITGNCGTSHKHLDEVIAGISKNGGQINLATLVGHKTLREAVMTQDPKGQPSLEQLKRMQTILDYQIRKGAFGLSTGLEYSPGLNAKIDEVATLAKVVARWNGIYATHLRNEGVDLEPSLDEAIETSRQAQVRLHISHLKIACQRDWGRMPNILQKLDEARAELPDLTADAYAYDRSSSGLDLLLPEEYRGYRGDRKALTGTPELAKKLALGMQQHLRGQGFPDYSFVRVVWTQDPGLRGLNVDEFPSSASSGVVATDQLASVIPDPGLREQTRSVMGLLRRGGGQMIYRVMNEEDMAVALQDPRVMVGSDSAVRGEDALTAHPRGCGNFPRVLRLLVRERKVMSLETALRKMSTLPAETFRIPERGRIAPGYWADLVVLDPNTIRDTATYEAPLERPEGISYVIVNGVPVLEGDRVYNRMPGKMLRNAFKDPGPLPAPKVTPPPQPKPEAGVKQLKGKKARQSKGKRHKRG